MSEHSQSMDVEMGAEFVPAPIDLKRRFRLGEMLIQGFLFICGGLSIFTTIGIVIILGTEALRFFQRELLQNTNRQLAASITAETDRLPVTTGGFQLSAGEELRIGNEDMLILEVVDSGIIIVERGILDTVAVAHDQTATLQRINRATLGEFFLTTRWIPQLGLFGVWPLLTSTLMTSAIAMVVAAPLGLAAAIYLSEYASPRNRQILKPMLEILAGIPTVVYGYFAISFITPILLRGVFGAERVGIYNTAAAGITIGILILPTVATLAEDALSAVPNSLREAAFGLGSTRFETALQVVVPAAISGILAAFILATSRAVGETMIVALAAGAGTKFTFNPFEGAETITGHIVRISGGDLSYDSIDYNSLFALGLFLFVLTLIMNITSRIIVTRFQEKYE